MLHRKKHMKVLALIVCATLLAQTLWPSLALALDTRYYNPATNDAIRNGVELSYGRTTGPGRGIVNVLLPDTSKTRTDVHNFAAVPGLNPMWNRAVVTKLDTAAIANIVTANRGTYIDSLINWKDPYTHSFITYDFDSLVANPLDTVVFSHVIVDTSLLDSVTMLSGDSARIAAITDRIRLQVANTVDNNDPATDDNSLVTLYLDQNQDRALDAGDTPVDSTTWFNLAPGESLYVLIATEIPVVNRDSSMDTVSLICQTERTSPSGRRLTKIYKDIITIELMQALDCMAWIVPDTVIAGSESYITYHFQLMVGNADEFRIVNPFAYFTDTTGQNYDSMWVTQVTYAQTDTYVVVGEDTTRRQGDTASWYYDELTDTLYVKFATSRINDQDTLRITFGQFVPTKVKYDTISVADTLYTYLDTQYLALFDDHIDPTEPDTADTILGIPNIWVVPDSARTFFLTEGQTIQNIRQSIPIDILVADEYGNWILTYTHPETIISMYAVNINTQDTSANIRYIVENDSSGTHLTPAHVFHKGLKQIAAYSDWPDSVVIWFNDTINNIVFGSTDTLYWIDSIAPLISYAATNDTNGNGILDRIMIRFDSPVENMDMSGFQIWFGTDYYPIDTFAIVNDTVMYLTLFEDPLNALGTGITPFISYDTTRGSITDRSELHNPMNDTNFMVLDSAGPVLLAAWYYDNGTPQLDDDSIEVQFSEPISDVSMDLAGASSFIRYSFDSIDSLMPNGFSGTITSTGATRNDGSALIWMNTNTDTVQVMQHYMNLVACAVMDLRGNCDPPNNQRVPIRDRTPPEVYWIQPIDSIMSSEVTNLDVKVRVVEWQQIGPDSVFVEWRVPYDHTDPYSDIKTTDSARARLYLRHYDIPPGHALDRGDSLFYGMFLDLTNPSYLKPGAMLAGNDRVIFSVVATDAAGNITRIADIETVVINAASRWYQCSRGLNNGYSGVGIHSGIGPFDAWSFVPRDQVIFDSVAISHFYNNELQVPGLDSLIKEANNNARINEYVTIVDLALHRDIHEYSIVDKFGNQRRYDLYTDQKLVIEIYYDDLQVSDPSKLTLFKLDDYSIVRRLDGSLDTIKGTYQWVPLTTDEVRVVPESMKVVYEVDVNYAPDMDGIDPLEYGLGVFRIMEYTPPEDLLSSVRNYPNPFDAGDRPTRISYVLTEDADISITICNMIGDLVWEASYKAGEEHAQGNPVGLLNVVEWDGRNGNGRIVGNGGYICKIKAVASGKTYQARRKIGVLK